MTTPNETPEDSVRAAVRDRYAAIARAIAESPAATCCGPSGCCSPDLTSEDKSASDAFGAHLYPHGEAATASTAVEASLGCGVPTAVADLHEGETVLDLGCGAGGDALISAARVGPRGRVYGLDMTDEMLALARRNALDAGVDNAVFLKGTIESIPLPASSVDVVISNCVINLSADKAAVFREAARVLRPGGRFAVSDVVADPDMDEATRADMAAWTGCIAGALTRDEFMTGLEAAGFEGVEVRETHRVHEHATAAIVRARLAER